MGKPVFEVVPHRGAVATDRPTHLTLVVRIAVPAESLRPHPLSRPPLNLGLCIDRSGSMHGEPLARAIEAATYLLQSLTPRDRVSLVAFSSSAEVLVRNQPATQVEPMIARLRGLRAGGGTALHLGWLESCFEVQRGQLDSSFSRVVLLSDGQATDGLTAINEVCAQVKDWRNHRQISTTTVGLGLNYNEQLLESMAQAGTGNFYHVQSPEDIATYFGLELETLSRTVGKSVSLGIQPLGGVQLLKVHNQLKQTPKGRLRLNDLVQGLVAEVVLELMVPPSLDSQDLCRFRLAWTEVQSQSRQVVFHELALPAVPAGQLSEFPVDLEVVQKRAFQQSVTALGEAASRLQGNDRAGARRVLEGALEGLEEFAGVAFLEPQRQRVFDLLSQLERGADQAVAKQAAFGSSSMSLGSMSSFVMDPAIRAKIQMLVKLRPEERTPEKIQEIMGPSSD